MTVFMQFSLFSVAKLLWVARIYKLPEIPEIKANQHLVYKLSCPCDLSWAWLCLCRSTLRAEVWSVWLGPGEAAETSQQPATNSTHHHFTQTALSPLGERCRCWSTFNQNLNHGFGHGILLKMVWQRFPSTNYSLFKYIFDLPLASQKSRGL